MARWLMPGPIALVLAVLLGQPVPDPAAGPAPDSPEPAPPGVAPARSEDLLHPGDLSLDVSLGLPARAAKGELELEGTGAVVAVPWHLGPLLAGLRFGLSFASARDVCTAEAYDLCGLALFFAGPVLRLSPLAYTGFAPWVEVSVTGFAGGGLVSGETSLGGFELPRIDAGIDFLPIGGARIGLFAFRSRTLFWGSAPIADGRVIMWGGGVRIANRN